MPTYVVLSKFTEQGRTDIKSTSDRLENLQAMVSQTGLREIATVITMGEYDVVTVLEAPSDEAVATAISGILARGNVTTTTMRGFTIQEFRQITSGLP